MKIAIDIDKTIFNCSSFLYKIINTYLINQNIDKELKYKVIEEDEYDYYINKFIKLMSRMHNPGFYKVEEDAVNIMKKWIDNKHEIILLSSRPSTRSLVGALLTCLKKYDVPFTKVVVACNNKAVYCGMDKIDVLIDDSHYICNNARKAGIDTIWYIAKYNNCPEKMPNLDCFMTARSWEELDNLIKIKTKNNSNKLR